MGRAVCAGGSNSQSHKLKRIDAYSMLHRAVYNSMRGAITTMHAALLATQPRRPPIGYLKARNYEGPKCLFVFR